MKVPTSIFAFFRGERPFSRKAYVIFVILMWIYALIWISVIVWIWHYWHGSVWFKVAVSFFAICVRPSLDVLTDSYDKYRRDWNEKIGERRKRES